MYAIVEIAGQQFKVENGKKIFVHRLEYEEGKELEFDKVLLIEDDGKITVGTPTVKDAVIGARVLSDKVRGDKVIVFKKKRKKGYRVKNGHRQNFTEIEIISVNGVKAPVRKASKKAESTETVVVAEETTKAKKAPKKTAAKKEEAPVKKAATKKTAEKKPAEKKPAAKKTTKK
jgi:large subunit ribosomal protein L21